MSTASAVNWPIVQLEPLLTDIQSGFASGKHNSEGEGVPHFRPMNVSTRGQIDRSVLKYVDPSAGRPDLRLRRGDVVFNNTNSPELVGKTALFEDDDTPAFSNHMTRLRTDPSRLDPAFLALRLHQAWREGWFAAHCNNHVSQASVGRDVLRSFEIALPPIEVQQAISEVGQALDARQMSSRGHLTAAVRAVDRFRRAVLAAGCSGRLTAEWRERNDTQSGKQLAEQLARTAGEGRRTWKVLDELKELPDLPETWGLAPFVALTVNHDGRRVPVKSTDRMNRRGPYPYYGASGIIDHVDAFLFEGDFLLISEDGANLLARATPIAFRASGQFWVNNHAHVVQGKSGVVDAYLEIVINGRDIQMYVTGSAQPKLTQAALNAMMVAVPPTAEQHEIVRRVNQLIALADHLDQRIEAASKHVDRSTRAILAKAFRGELVTHGGDR